MQSSFCNLGRSRGQIRCYRCLRACYHLGSSSWREGKLAKNISNSATWIEATNYQGFILNIKHSSMITYLLFHQAQVLSGENSIATRLTASPNKRHIAIGYADGTIKTFDLRSGETISIFIGHRSEITALAYDSLGHRLASGSKVRYISFFLSKYCLFFLSISSY